MTELASQKEVVEWLRTHYPDVIITCTGAGSVTAASHRKMTQMGYTKGMPDIFIFAARSGFHGFAIEMKSPKGRLRPEQRDVLKRLSLEGYNTFVAHSADEAIKEIVNYLG